MPVNVVKQSFQNSLKQYEIIHDCTLGEQRIKFRRQKYLPIPNSEDSSTSNLERYQSYLLRAVFYNVTKRTLNGLVGQVFSRDPTIKVPSQLDATVGDITGLGVNCIQLAKQATKNVIAYGRTGLFVDHPKTDSIASIADIQSGRVRPFFRLYDPWDIINWRMEIRGAQRILSMVVIQEPYVTGDDGFTETYGKQYRVLQLIDGIYTNRVYRDRAPNIAIENVTPTDANGQPFNELPFSFIGSENNDPDIDEPPLYDLASLNIAHYRNSADYEESCFIAGQPTPYFTGLTENWVNNVLKGRVQLGSRAAVPLPINANAGMLQIDPNSMPKEAMEHKERQMVALGAKLVEQRQIQRTATEAGLETSDETSTLATSADNVSDAFEKALKLAGRFVGADSTELEFTLNTEFDLIKLAAQDRQQLIAEWIAEAITFGEMRSNLRRGGIASIEDETARADIKANPPPKLVVAGLPSVKPGQSPNDNPTNQPTGA